MKIIRVKIPSYRAINSLDLTLQPELSPQVFAIGGRNGSGKSSLLQLLFIILRCSQKPKSGRYLTALINNSNLDLIEITQDYLLEIAVLDDVSKRLYEFQFRLSDLSKKDKTEGYTQVFSHRLNLKPKAIGTHTRSLCTYDYICNVKNDGHKPNKLVVKAQKILNKLRERIFIVTDIDTDFLWFTPQDRRQSGGIISRYYYTHCLLVKQQLKNVHFYGQEIGAVSNAWELSKGELKLKALEYWLSRLPDKSIVLIDEIENSLHPELQFAIASDLPKFNDSQYILATHSYEVCNALTPAHVKEI